MQKSSLQKIMLSSVLLAATVWAGSALPTLTSSPSPSPSIETGPGIKTKQAGSATLKKEFARAQASEMKALDHQCKFELKELKASQDAKQKEWRHKENEARHKFFDEHPKGSERRDYVQDFMNRRDAFTKTLAEEKARLVKDQEARVSALKAEQSTKLRLFNESLKKGEIPSKDLWPRAGM